MPLAGVCRLVHQDVVNTRLAAGRLGNEYPAEEGIGLLLVGQQADGNTVSGDLPTPMVQSDKRDQLGEAAEQQQGDAREPDHLQDVPAQLFP